ncbi:class I SAM-dependent methyltransferase [Embleya sp. NBC_00896]|uniref:O-methyltransferase n=1 Tax=Embleya sp. NBC_00896 TaxID=2975961 RepID=UPI002F9124C7|nr:class I SAM-dependent methyltransferase [Embleya sp. NBC_00896]
MTDATPTPFRPASVVVAEESARARGFRFSCAPEAGRLLAVLAAAVPPGGRILELGTGAGVGAAWIVSGVAPGAGIEFITVERDAELAAENARFRWPEGIDFRVGDNEELLPTLGMFDLIFADAEGGKWSGLDTTIAALHPGGILIVDDMDPTRVDGPDHRRSLERVRETLTTHPDLLAAELPTATGLILATRRQ